MRRFVDRGRGTFGRAVMAAAGGAMMVGLACSGGEDIRPPKIHYGEDICAECGMIVSEERFAAGAAVRTPAGSMEYPSFDDIGCLFLYEGGEHGNVILARYTHDAATEEWFPVEQGHFIQSAEIRTPMGSGVAAFAVRERAVEEGRRLEVDVMDFPGLVALDASVGLIARP